MVSKSQKILVCGDVLGEFDQLFKKVNSVHQKAGPFDMLLCTGDFFSDGDNSQWLPYKRGACKVPLLTFVLGPCQPGHEEQYPDLRGGELAHNVVYLGPSGIYPCSSGLRIAYLSGNEKLAGLKQGYTNYQVGQLEAEGRQLGVIDVLLARNWPSFVSTFARKPTGEDIGGCPLVSRLAHAIKPRYHFASSQPIYHERLPYRNHQVLQEPARHCTRFFGLANVGNTAKTKWLYAFTITPGQHCPTDDLAHQPQDVTECPYSTANLPPITQEERQINQFFYGGAPKEPRGQKRDNDKQGGGREKRLPPAPTGPCWFCLSSPEVEKHLIVSVGEHTYLSLAKGGLVPHHLMIMPIHHYQTSLDLEKQAVEELNRFKKGLCAMFAASGRCVVFYERNYRTTHMQLHAVPLPDTLAPAVMPAFKDHAECQGLDLEEVPRRTELSAAVQPGQPFLSVEPPHGHSLLCRVKKGYNMRFDREVLASEDLLNLPARVDWKDCKLSCSHETQLRDDMRSLFKPFDFTVDSDNSSSSSSSSEEEDCADNISDSITK